MHTLRTVAALALTLAMPLVSVPLTAVAGTPEAVWVRSTGVSLRSVDPATAETVENVTLRFTARLTLGGDHARISLSNVFGATPLRIGGASLSFMVDGKLQVVPVTFSGQTATTLPPGAPVLSDPVDAGLGQGQVVNISLFLPDKTALIGLHSDDHTPSAVSAPGNFVMAESFEVARSLTYQPFFNGIDVVASSGAKTIVAFGDLITDAGDDTSGTPWRWGDVLAQRLAAAGKPYAVATEAISGNRIVTDGGGNRNALSRFDRDVLSVPNVGYIVMLEGINDVGHSGFNPSTQMTEPLITADDVISGYKQIIARAHEHGIKVYGAEILPFKGAKYDSNDHDAMLVAINAWIRTAGAFDGLVDFKSAVADPADPLQLNPALERGDHLHPNNEGQRAMARAIDLKLFK